VIPDAGPAAAAGRWQGLVPLLMCPACRTPLSVLASFDAVNAVLGHVVGPCAERYPVIADVPRILIGPARDRLYDELRSWFLEPAASVWFADWGSTIASPSTRDQVVARFDREWTAFADVETDEQAEVFRQYFDVMPKHLLTGGGPALDAGCGAGRWAIQVAKAGRSVVALDAGRSVELAHQNGRVWPIAGVQGDVAALPFADATFDFVYSLGVLHHVEQTDRAAAEIVRVLRPGGHFLVYLYYALDNRGPVFRGIYGMADVLRRLLSRSPQAVVGPISAMIATIVYLPLARTARAMQIVGLRRIAAALPLSYYAERSFRTMLNDSLDRFGTRLEKRFTRAQVIALLERAGLRDVRVAATPPYWHASARRP
jgi:SAM-dependent methyltransferase/uncharacterized protein YbaR (Trm112 family)